MIPVLERPVTVRSTQRCGRPEHTLARHRRRLVADADAVDAVTCALSQVLAAGDVETPIVLAAADYGIHAANRFVERLADPGRSLRPSDSIALEANGLLAGFIAATSWSGRCSVVLTPDLAGRQALRWARAVVASGRRTSAAVCEVTADDGSGFRVTAARVCAAGAVSGPRSQACDAPHDVAEPCDTLTAAFVSGRDGEPVPTLTSVPRPGLG